MKIKESKNLNYTKCPPNHFESPEWVELKKCILDYFHTVDDVIELYFKNGRTAVIEAKNAQGSLEMSRIKERLDDFVNKSYEDILNADF